MNNVTVEVRRTIGVGKKYHIAPTMAFSGVLQGIVEVLEIAKKEDIVDPNAQVSISCYIFFLSYF